MDRLLLWLPVLLERQQLCSGAAAVTAEAPATPVELGGGAAHLSTHLLVFDGHGGHFLDLVDQLVRTFGTGSVTLTGACVYWYCKQVEGEVRRTLSGVPRACGSPEDCKVLDAGLEAMSEWFHGPSFRGLQMDDYQSTAQDQGLRRAFASTFQHIIGRFDIVFCQYPLLLCASFLPTDVRIVVRLTNRFDYFACSQESRVALAQDLHAISKARGQVFASTLFDQRYVREVLNLTAPLWPSLSLYAVGTAAAGGGAELEEPRPEVLVLPDTLRNDYPCMAAIQSYLEEVQRQIESSAGPPACRLVNLRDAHSQYSLGDLATHRAALVLPYTTPIATVSEAHALGLTLLVPSPALLATLHRERGVLCQLTSPCRQGHGSTSILETQDLQQWLLLSDIYQWPNVMRFSSQGELLHLLRLLYARGAASRPRSPPPGSLPRHLRERFARTARMLRAEVRRQSMALVITLLQQRLAEYSNAAGPAAMAGKLQLEELLRPTLASGSCQLKKRRAERVQRRRCHGTPAATEQGLARPPS